MGELATTNHLKGAILLQCKPFTSRVIKGSIGCRENKMVTSVSRKILIWSFKKKPEGLSSPAHTLLSPRLAASPTPTPPCSGAATSYECETFLADLGSRKFGRSEMCNEHKSKADVLKKHLINLSSTYSNLSALPSGQGWRRLVEGIGHLHTTSDFREPPLMS